MSGFVILYGTLSQNDSKALFSLFFFCVYNSILFTSQQTCTFYPTLHAQPKHDDYKTFSKLVRECGAVYCNSGLGKRFLREMQKSSSSGNLIFNLESAGSTGDGERLPSAADFMEMNYNTQPAPPKETVRLGLPW